MKNIFKEILKALSAGIITAGILMALAFGLFPKSMMTITFLWPGERLLSILVIMMPWRLMYWLVPEGGLTATLFLVLLGALIFWIFLGAGLWLILSKLHITRKLSAV